MTIRLGKAWTPILERCMNSIRIAAICPRATSWSCATTSGSEGCESRPFSGLEFGLSVELGIPDRRCLALARDRVPESKSLRRPVAFGRRPRGEILVVQRRVRAGFDLEHDSILSMADDGMPGKRGDLYSKISVCAVEIDTLRQGSGIIEHQNGKCPFHAHHQLPAALPSVPMWPHVGARLHRVEQALYGVIQPGVNVQVGAKPGYAPRFTGQGFQRCMSYDRGR